MKKKVIIIIVSVIIVVGLIIFLIPWMFSSQYNKNGISHYLVITVDKNQSKTYIGELEGLDVYIEGLSIKDSNFRTIDAKNLSIKDAIKNDKVSIEEWKKYAWKITRNNNYIVYEFENYKIEINNKELIFKPLSR